MIKNAEKKDVKECAQLIHISGPHLFTYLYNLEEPDIFTLLESMSEAEETSFSYKNCLLDVEGERIRGLIIALPFPIMKKYTTNELKFFWKVKKGLFPSLIYFFKVFSRLLTALKYPHLMDDEYYISNLAVYSPYRGQGIGKNLLKVVEDRAKNSGYNKLCLYVELDNNGAIKLYEKFGFNITASVTFPQKLKKHGLEGLHKMVKEL